MQLMIDETERFVGEIDDAIAKIGEFKAALASIPDTKVVTIVTKYVSEGKPEDIQAATETLTEHVNVVEDVNGNLGDLNSKLAEATAANKAFSESAGDTVDRLIAEAKAAEPVGAAMAAAAAGAAVFAKTRLMRRGGPIPSPGHSGSRLPGSLPGDRLAGLALDPHGHDGGSCHAHPRDDSARHRTPGGC